MKKLFFVSILFALSSLQVMAKCDEYSDVYNIKFEVNNATDGWMYLWMGHPREGEDNGNLNIKPHSRATALGCSNGLGYAVSGIILNQEDGRKSNVLYTFDVGRPYIGDGYVRMYPQHRPWPKKNKMTTMCWLWYVAPKDSDKRADIPVVKMESWQSWNYARAYVRIDCFDVTPENLVSG